MSESDVVGSEDAFFKAAIEAASFSFRMSAELK
jgi:hypothetical protein